MKLKQLTARSIWLALATLLCLTVLSGCSKTKQEPLTPEVVTVTKVVELPRQKAQRYQLCQVDENVPGFTDNLPAYTAGLMGAVDECNRRNELISNHNESL